MSKRAVILAGGAGTRLRPYTVTLPKPLVPLGNRPILEIVIGQLKEHGFTHITIAVNHAVDIIKAFFNDGSKWGVTIDYTMETKPLSTMGPLTLAKDLPENFLVMNGDVLTDLDFSRFHENHVASNAIFTIASYRRSELIDYGLLHKGKDNRLIRFEEKPHYDFLVSMGVYMMNRDVLKYIPKDTFFGFDHLMHRLIEKNNPATVYEYNGFWLDIGRPADYEAASELVNDPDFKLI